MSDWLTSLRADAAAPGSSSAASAASAAATTPAASARRVEELRSPSRAPSMTSPSDDDSESSSTDDITSGVETNASTAVISAATGNGTGLPNINRRTTTIKPSPEGTGSELLEEDAVYILDPTTENYIIKCATIEKLVEKLTSETSADVSFLNAFLLMYRAFSTPRELFDLLVKRFNITPPAGLPKDQLETFKNRIQIPVRLRVFNVCKNWISNYFDDFENESLFPDFLLFIQNKMAQSGMETSSQTLLRIIDKKLKPDEAPVLMTGKPPAPITGDGMWDAAANKLHVLRCPPEELARQLTLIESCVFRSIKPGEFLMQGWLAKDKETRAPRILANIARFNQVSQWVGTELLTVPDPKLRIALLEHFISTAQYCFKYNNFCTCLEIMSGLQATSVWRLKDMWSSIQRELQEQFNEMVKCFRVDRNWKRSRELLKAAVPPCIPYLGMYLTDLVFLDEGTPNTENGLINFDKFRKIAKVIQEIQLYQQTIYTLEPIEPIQDYLRTVVPLNHAELFSLSYAILPRGAGVAASQGSPSPGEQSPGTNSKTPTRDRARRKNTQRESKVSAPCRAEQDLASTGATLRQGYPVAMREALTRRFPSTTPTKWKAVDQRGTVFGWMEDVQLDLFETAAGDCYITHQTVNATRADVAALLRLLKFYTETCAKQGSGTGNVQGLLVTLTIDDTVLQLAREVGLEVLQPGAVMAQAAQVPNLTMSVQPVPQQLDYSTTAVAPAAGGSNKSSWLEFFVDECGLTADIAEKYTALFAENAIELDQLADLNPDVLKDLGVRMGHLMKITRAQAARTDRKQ